MSIKICSLDFKDNGKEDKWANFALFGECLQNEVKMFDNYREFDIKLPVDEVWQVAFDQSTTCTGIAIKNQRNTKFYMVEVQRNRGVTSEQFIFDLEMFLHNLFNGCVVSHVIYERPIKSESYVSSRILFQLEGIIRILALRYEEFKAARMEFIENSSWRRVVIRPEYTTYSNRKHATEESIKDLFPWSAYYGFPLGKDCDVFEAMGVMFGWFFNSFDELGRPYVRGDKFNGNIGAFILPNVSAQEVSKNFEEAGLKSSWAMEYPRNSIYENIACAVKKYEVVCVEITQPSTMLALYIESGIRWDAPDRVCLVVTASNFTDQRLFSITGDKYHFVL